MLKIQIYLQRQNTVQPAAKDAKLEAKDRMIREKEFEINSLQSQLRATQVWLTIMHYCNG